MGIEERITKYSGNLRILPFHETNGSLSGSCLPPSYGVHRTENSTNPQWHSHELAGHGKVSITFEQTVPEGYYFYKFGYPLPEYGTVYYVSAIPTLGSVREAQGPFGYPVALFKKIDDDTQTIHEESCSTPSTG